jgi:ATP-dependent RNA helicase RhlE
LIRKREKLDLELERVPGFEPVDEPPAPAPGSDGTGGIKGKRPSKKDKLRAAAAQAEALSAKKPV